MRLYVALVSVVVAGLGLLLSGCPGPGRDLRAQSAAPGAAPVRGAPEPKITGPDRVEPFRIGRYAARPEFPFYSWRVEPAGADVQPFHGNQYVDIVARPGKYKLTLTVGGRRGRNSEVSKDIEFAPAEVDAPPDGVDAPPPDVPPDVPPEAPPGAPPEAPPGLPGDPGNPAPRTDPQIF
jgi:hypothetical protein